MCGGVVVVILREYRGYSAVDIVLVHRTHVPFSRHHQVTCVGSRADPLAMETIPPTLSAAESPSPGTSAASEILQVRISMCVGAYQAAAPNWEELKAGQSIAGIASRIYRRNHGS